jgi:hypothetical protein
MKNFKTHMLFLLALASIFLIFVIWFIGTQMGTRYADLTKDDTSDLKKCSFKNGEYIAIYDKEYSGYENYDFLVNDNVITYHQTDHLETKLINWKNDTTFSLDSTRKIKDSLSTITKHLNSLGVAYYEIYFLA